MLIVTNEHEFFENKLLKNYDISHYRIEVMPGLVSGVSLGSDTLASSTSFNKRIRSLLSTL